MTLGLLDQGVILVYGLVVLAIGAIANRKQKTPEDYYVGGRSLPWWAVGVSILATSFSSTALIGGTGAGFSARGLQMLQWQIGDLLAFGLVAAVFLPFFAKLRLVSAYEFLEDRLGVRARRLASALFLAQTLLRAGLLVYAPALALSVVLGWSIEAAITVTTVCALVYSSFGGISAVVWTDLLQVGVVVAGVVCSLLTIAGDVPGGFQALLEHAQATDRLRPIDLTFDPQSAYNLWWVLGAYSVLALSVAGTNQQAVQRYSSCKDLASARKAAIFGWAIGALIMAATLLLGVGVQAWQSLVPEALPSGLAGDKVLPTLIVARLPAGLAGLMIAAIFAASMSSIDSAIHAMSTAVLIDWVRPLYKDTLSDGKELRLARWLTAGLGLVTLGVAFVAARQRDSLLLDTMVRWLGYTAGPMLGLFVLAMWPRRVSETAALVGAGLSTYTTVLVVFYEGPKSYAFHSLWLAPLALFASILVALIWNRLSSARAAPERAISALPEEP